MCILNITQCEKPNQVRQQDTHFQSRVRMVTGKFENHSELLFERLLRDEQKYPEEVLKD